MHVFLENVYNKEFYLWNVWINMYVFKWVKTIRLLYDMVMLHFIRVTFSSNFEMRN